MRFANLTAAAVLLAGALALGGCPAKTVVDRAIEARSAEDIVTDNQIVIDVNAIMVDLGTIKASTEIYEQRLLVTGLFDDKALYEAFRRRIRDVAGVKKLYWHAAYLSDAEREAQAGELIAWDDALLLDAKATLSLVETRGVADVNYRIAVDGFGTVYMMGRARSQEELDKALAAVWGTAGVNKLVNYAVVRP